MGISNVLNLIAMTSPTTDPIIHHDVHTVDKAIDLFLNQLPLEQAKQLAAMEEWELPDLHYGLGMAVRRMFNMWDNLALIENCGADNPDDAGAVVVWGVWKKLRDVSL